VIAASDGCRNTHLLTLAAGQATPALQKCYDKIPAIQEELLTKWHPSVIVALDRWEIIDFRAPDGHTVKEGTAEHVTLEGAALANLARQLTASGSKLSFIRLPPLLNAKCSRPENYPATWCHVVAAHESTQAPYNAIFDKLAATLPGVSTISLTEAMCPGGICVPVVNGLLLRFDGNHFTAPAARWLAPVIYRQLVRAGVLD
jgi:lysophospholipase L1-like esterase